MKILFTYEYTFSKFGFGGGQVIALNLIEVLKSRGYEVAISCNGEREIEYSENVKFFYSEKKSGTFSSILAAFHAVRVIRKFKPDLVCSFTGEAFAVALYCNWNNIKFCTYIAAPDLPVFSLRRPIRSALNCRFYLTHFFQFLGVKQTKNNFTISEYTLNHIVKNWGIPKEHVKNVGCGVSNEFLGASLPLEDRIVDICSTGRIEFNQKPINITAEALFKYNVWHKWFIVGTGHDQMQLMKLLEQYGISSKVEFFGSLPNKRVAQLLRAVKVSILVSTKESFLISAYEAIASQNILVVSDVAQIRYDFEKFPTVFILKENSSEEITRYLQHILTNYLELYGLTYLARDYVLKNYTWDKVANNFLNDQL